MEALRTHAIGTNVTLGGNMSLTETMEVLKKASMRSGFQYLKYLVDHIDLVANVPVRNVNRTCRKRKSFTILMELFSSLAR